MTKGIDAYVWVDFAGNPKLKTQVMEVSMSMYDWDPIFTAADAHPPPTFLLPSILLQVVRADGEGNLSASFNQSLWLPVMVPTMTNMIKVRVQDRDKVSAAPCFHLPPCPLPSFLHV